MNLKKFDGRTFLSVWLVALLLVACGEKPDALLLSAKDYLAKNDNKAAVIQIKNALQVDPDLPEARFLLGATLLETGDPVGAELELRKALTFMPSLTDRPSRVRSFTTAPLSNQACGSGKMGGLSRNR